MPVDQLISELLATKPGLEPFVPYVIGMKREVMPLIFEDPCVGAVANIFINDLGMAHDLIESLEGNQVAAYLHGIIHRREGDFWNANYWFRQAKDVTRELDLDPEALTARVEQADSIDSDLQSELLNEWKSLASYIINNQR